MKILSPRLGRILSVVLLVIVVTVGTFTFYTTRSKNSASAHSDNPISGVGHPKKTPTSTSTTSSLPPLPQPQDSPDNPYADVPVNQIGSISIPKIGMTQNLYEGVWLTVLNVGPGHWPGTAMPGQYGNTVIAGHRVTHTKPFRHIDDLVAGDDIMVTTKDGTFDYKVTSYEIVLPTDIQIVDQTPGFRITLFACNPPGSATQRYVIHGELVNPPFKVPEGA